MKVNIPSDSTGIDYNELATLKQLAKYDAMSHEVKISNAMLAKELDISLQTVSRRLVKLEESDLIHRQPASDGQHVFILEKGKEAIWAEYEDYRRLFDSTTDLILTGTVVDGLGEGKHYISLDGYMTQFEEKLGYRPYAGTLNVELENSSRTTRKQLLHIHPVHIDGWEDHDRSYGPVYCYPGSIAVNSTDEIPIHVIRPERTHHGDDHLEVLAEDKLRTELDIETGDRINVRIHQE